MQTDTAPTQADRDAAIRLLEAGGQDWQAKEIRCGNGDHYPLVQAFARHRLASTAAREPVEAVAWMYEYINGLMHYSRARDELLSMQPVEEWTETPLYAAPPTPDVAELVERLAWAIGKLDECGQQVEFTLGMARSLNDCRTVLAKHGGAK